MLKGLQNVQNVASKELFSFKRLSVTEELNLIRIQEELLYSCGCSLFPEGPNRDAVVVKEGITCSSSIETTYYANITRKSDLVCFHCGDIEAVTIDQKGIWYC